MAKTNTTKLSFHPRGNSRIQRALATFLLSVLLLVNAGQTYAATITVDTLNDNLLPAGDCGLRDAINAANTNAAVDTCAAGEAAPTVDNIEFSTGPGTITLGGTQLPTITETVNINADTDNDHAPDITVDAAGTSRALDVNAPAVSVRGFNFLNGAQAGLADVGGTIRVRSAADLTLLDSDIDTSTAPRGGAIGIDSGSGTVSLDNVNISNTTAGNGGAIYLDHEMVNPDPDDTDLTIDNSTITNSTATSGSGGGIYIGVNNEALIQNTTITNADAAQYGGGIYHAGEMARPVVDTPNLNLSGVTIVNSDANTSAGMFNGGGIFLGGSMETVSDGSLLLDNNTAFNGGGIYLSSGGSLQINGALGQEAVFQNNSASSSGGALNIGTSVAASSISHANFFTNDSTASGGAICINSSNTTNISDSNFYQNSSVNGGAISTAGGLGLGETVTLNIDNSNFEGNTGAGGAGGAIYAGVRSIMDFAGVTTDVAGQGPVNNSAGQGGFLYMANVGDNSSLTMTDSNISNNNSTSCGGAMTLNSAFNTLLPPLLLTNVVMSNNTSTDRGGAICMPLGSMLLNNVDFTDNSAADYGGAMFIGNGGGQSSAEITNGSNFTDNSVENLRGGAISIFQVGLATSQMSVNGSAFSVALPGPLPIEAGGAIYNQDSSVDINNSTFNSDDIARVDNGGAIYSSGGTLNLTSSSISDFATTANGGAIYNNTGNTTTITDSTLQSNIAGGSGGAVYSKSQLNILKSYIGENQSTDGGGVYINSSNFSLRNSTIDSNDATGGDGGGIYFAAGAIAVSIISSTIAYNHALGWGGGFYKAFADMNMNNTILEGNTSTTFGPNSDCKNLIGGISTGHNLISYSDNCGAFFQPSDIIDQSANLDLLAMYGGTTLNYNLLAGSPAIDAGDTAEATDQRGVARPQNVSPDIGSHEYEDNDPPVIAEVTPVPTPDTDTTPDYTFSSTESGTITYNGGCTSATAAATVGAVTVTFTALDPGTYALCTITVTDLFNNISNLLAITSFTITEPAPPLPPVVPVPDPPSSGGSARFGQPSCSGDACSGNTKVVVPEVTTPPKLPVEIPQPTTTSTVTTPVTTPASTGGAVTTGSNSGGGRLTTTHNTARPTAGQTTPVITEPIATDVPVDNVQPAAPEKAVLPPITGARILPGLIITTPDSGLKSADDTPFIMGEGPVGKATDIYLFDSQDFDEIRDLIKQQVAEKYPDATPEQADTFFKKRFTSMVITILDKYLQHTLDPENTVEAKFTDRVLKLGTAKTGQNKLFLLDSDKKVRDNTYLAVATQWGRDWTSAIYSKEVEFTVDSALSVLTPEIKTLGGKTLSADALIGNLRVEMEPGNLLPTLVGRIKQPSKIVANWQSDISTSALIADSLDEEFRLSAPSPLLPGDHTVFVTAYRRADNAGSDTLKINFHLAESVPFNIYDYWWVLIAPLALLIGLILLFIIKKRKTPPTASPAPGVSGSTQPEIPTSITAPPTPPTPPATPNM